METRQFINDICQNVISNFTIKIPHNNKMYDLKLSYDQAQTIRNEIYHSINSLQLSGALQTISEKIMSNDINFLKFVSSLVGHLSFNNDFSILSKNEKVNRSGWTGLYYDNLIFEVNEFKEEQFWNSPLPKFFGCSANQPAKDLKSRFNMKVEGARKELIIAVYCKSLADFGDHADHLALAKEMKNPNNQIIAAMRKPYGQLAFFSSAKEINSKAYFAYQHHIFTALLGTKVTSSVLGNLPLDMGKEISFFLSLNDIDRLASVNKNSAKISSDTCKEYEEIYYRKRT